MPDGVSFPSMAAATCTSPCGTSLAQKWLLSAGKPRLNKKAATNKCTCKNGFGRDSAQEKYFCKAPDFLTAIDSSTTLKYCTDACPSEYTASSSICTVPSGDDLYTVLMNTKETCR